MRQLSLVITAMLAATALSVIATPLVYAQESETETEINNKQEGTASGESTNNFCANNQIGTSLIVPFVPSFNTGPIVCPLCVL